MPSRDNPALPKYPEDNKTVGHLTCRKSSTFITLNHFFKFHRSANIFSLLLPITVKKHLSIARRSTIFAMISRDFDFSNHNLPQLSTPDINSVSEFPSLGGNGQAQQQNPSFGPGVSPWRTTRSPGPERRPYSGGIGRGRVIYSLKLPVRVDLVTRARYRTILALVSHRALKDIDSVDNLLVPTSSQV
jgi:hypothetical protein